MYFISSFKSADEVKSFFLLTAVLSYLAETNPSMSRSISLNNWPSYSIYFPVNWDAMLLTTYFFRWQSLENFFSLSKFKSKLSVLILAFFIQGWLKISSNVYLFSSGCSMQLIRSLSYLLTFFISGMSKVYFPLLTDSKIFLSFYPSKGGTAVTKI